MMNFKLPETSKDICMNNFKLSKISEKIVSRLSLRTRYEQQYKLKIKRPKYIVDSTQIKQTIIFSRSNKSIQILLFLYCVIKTKILKNIFFILSELECIAFY